MKNKSSDTFAVITGASKGFGKFLALELAQRRKNLILIALPHENISLVAGECQKFNVCTHIYEGDLTKKEELLKMTQWINDNFDVNILINNAGRGGTEQFHTSSLTYIEDLIQINVVATSIVTHQLLPNLMKQSGSYILNVSSMASISPIGFKTVYSASKRYIQHFSCALNQELKGTSVSVSVVLPGPMRTNSEITGRIEKQGILGRLSLVKPQRAARVSISAMFRKKSIILIGRQNYINHFLLSLIPPKLRMKLMTRAAHRELEP